MGNYVPHNKVESRSVVETLREAEENHVLDCPDAEIRLRIAALLLDVLLCALAISGLQHFCIALNAHLSHLTVSSEGGTLFSFLTSNSQLVSSYLFIGLKVAFSYLYFIWSLAYAAGSPGKLLLGLRVVDAKTGKAPTFWRALVREVTKVFSVGFLFGIVVMLTREDFSTLHDSFANTKVKRLHGRI